MVTPPKGVNSFRDSVTLLVVVETFRCPTTVMHSLVSLGNWHKAISSNVNLKKKYSILNIGAP